jgi:MFS family permease
MVGTCSPGCVQKGALALGFATNVFGGFVYVYPIYTTALQNVLGLTDGQVTVIGTVAHFGLAVISYPASMVYRSECGGRLSPRCMDVLTNAVTMVVQIGSSLALAFLIEYYCPLDENDPSSKTTCEAASPIFEVVLFFYLMLGIGVGLAFGHGVWVNGANFHYNLKQKAASVSAISFAIGVGSMLLVVAYNFAQLALGTDTIRVLFWFQAVVYLLIGLGRIFVMYRIDTTELERAEVLKVLDADNSGEGSRKLLGGEPSLKPTLQDWAATSAPESMLSIRNALRGNGSNNNLVLQPSITSAVGSPLLTAGRHRDSTGTQLSFSNAVGTGRQRDSTGTFKVVHSHGFGVSKPMSSPDDDREGAEAGDEVDADDNNSNNASMLAYRMLCCTPLPQFTFWCVFFGIGLGGAFQSMLGFLSPLYATDAADASNKTFASLVVFLAAQVVARFICVMVYRFYRVQSLLVIVWEVMEFVACIMLICYPANYSLYIVACALFGMGFGGNLSSLAAIVAAHYPGGAVSFPFNFGITMLAPAFGNVAVGLLESLLTSTSCTGNQSVSAHAADGVASLG